MKSAAPNTESIKHTFDENSLLEIFDQNNLEYLNIHKINQWFGQAKNTINFWSNDFLILILRNITNLKAFERNFFKTLSDRIIDQVDSFGYADLAEILFNLQKIQYTNNVNLISAIVETIKTKNFDAIPEQKELVKVMWSLAKLGYHNIEFFKKWTEQITGQLDKLDAIDLTQILQSMATLRFFDEEFINRLFNSREYLLFGDDQRRMLNNAFYLTMLSVNNFDFETNDPLKIKINNNINILMSNLNIDNFLDKIAKQQLLQIHDSKIYTISELQIKEIKQYLKAHAEINTSISQEKIKRFIEKTFPKLQVILEYYDESTGAFIDLRVEAEEHSLDIEFDGPEHYFINQRSSADANMRNGATVFRDRIYFLHHNRETHIITYEEIVKVYHAKLIEAINTKIGHAYQIEEENQKSLSQKATIESKDSEISNIPQKAKKTKIKPKALRENKEEDFDQILAELAQEKLRLEEMAKQPGNELELVRLKYPNEKNRINDAIDQKDLKSIQIILEHYKQTKSAEEINKILRKIKLENKILARINSDSLASKNYIQILDLLLEYGLKVVVNSPKYVAALIHAYSYGEVDTFARFLALFPNNVQKKQLMEYFFINVGSLYKIEIGEYLLSQGVDVNSVYSRESIEILYAAVTGFDHVNVKFLKFDQLVLKLYNNIVKGDGVVENSLHEIAGDFLDKVEGSNNLGASALHKAMYRGYPANSKVVDFLIKAGANPNTMNIDNINPLITALILRDEKTAIKLLDFFGDQINLDLKGFNDLTAANLAAFHGFTEVLKKLAELGANFNIPVKQQSKFKNLHNELLEFRANQAPLDTALSKGYLDAAKIILHEGKANPNHRGLTLGNSMPISPLKFSIKYHPEFVEDLLAVKGIDINEEDTSYTPVMMAAELSNIKSTTASERVEVYKRQELGLVEQFVLNGAKIHLRNLKGELITVYAEIPERTTYHSQILNEILCFEDYGRGEINLEKRFSVIKSYLSLYSSYPLKLDSLNYFIKNDEKTFTSTPLIVGPITNLVVNFKSKDGIVVTKLIEEVEEYDTIFIEEQTKITKFFYYKNLGINVGNVFLGVITLYKHPNYENLKTLVVDSNYLAGAYFGNNMYSSVITFLNAVEDFQNKEYGKLAVNSLVNVVYMVGTSYLLTSGNPYTIILAGSAMSFWSGYNFISKLNSFIDSYGSEKDNIESIQDYQRFYTYLSKTPLQYVYDFQELAEETETNTSLSGAIENIIEL